MTDDPYPHVSTLDLIALFERMYMLGMNFRWAGALAEAYRLGHEQGYDDGLRDGPARNTYPRVWP